MKKTQAQRTESFRRRFFKRLRKFPNIFIIYRTVAVVLVWSGIWGLSDELIFPNDPIFRYSIVLLTGIFLLYIDDYSLSELSDIRQISDLINDSKDKTNEVKK